MWIILLILGFGIYILYAVLETEINNSRRWKDELEEQTKKYLEEGYSEYEAKEKAQEYVEWHKHWIGDDY